MAAIVPQEGDQFWMQRAVEWARRSMDKDHMPFGTVIVHPHPGLPSRVLAIATGTETPCNPTRHSEMRAIREACVAKGGLLQGCTIYQTHEPCHMCIGAIHHAKLSRVIWGSIRRDFPQLFRPYTIPWSELMLDTSQPPEVRLMLGPECRQLMWDWVELKVATTRLPGGVIR